MLPSRLLFVLGLLVLATGCDSKPPSGPSGPLAPGPSGPTSTGPIAFVSDRDGTEQIYLANEDGSAVTRLTPGTTPAWSRDGRRIAFAQGGQISVINVDGSGLRRVTDGWNPHWSADDRMLAFEAGLRQGIDAVDADGSNRRRLYEHAGSTVYDPAWSPDGRRIGFIVHHYGFSDIDWGLWTVNATGSDPKWIGYYDLSPAWSPDGSRIAFVHFSGDVGIVSADGTLQQLRAASQVREVDWSADGRLIFTRSQGPDRFSPGQRIVISEGGVERQLIPEAAPPVKPGYSDREATWRR